MSLRAVIVSQFKQPSGLLGRLAGFIMSTRPSNRQRGVWTVELLDVKPGHRVLEIGCGTGISLKCCAMKLKTGKAIGIDHSELMVRHARKRLGAEITRGVAEVRLADVTQIRSDFQRYDRIFSVNVVQFLPDMQQTYEDIISILLPGGIAATTYLPRSSQPTRDEAVAMANKIAGAMESAGFKDVKSKELALKPVPAFCVLGTKPVRTNTP